MIRFELLFFIGILAVIAATDVKSSAEVDCERPFVEVGGRCLHLELRTKGTWAEMRQFCQELGSDLVNLADVQFYSDLILYINNLNLPTTRFWIGATDERVEGIWEWTDGTPVRMGTPYWANYGNNTIFQMPTGGTNQNCAIIDGGMHNYLNDWSCSTKVAPPICESFSDTKADCESPFVEVGGHCLHLEPSTEGTWVEMRRFCQELGGDLVNLADVQFYSDLILYMNNLNLMPLTCFWIGATDERVEGFWEWTDGTPVRMGTPYWANYGNDYNHQMPTGGTAQNCAIIDGGMHNYLNDMECSGRVAPPICEK